MAFRQIHTPAACGTQLLCTDSPSAAQIHSTAWPAKEIVSRCAKHLLPAAVGRAKPPRSCCQGKEKIKTTQGKKEHTGREGGARLEARGPSSDLALISK